jgi:hypothetical protein
LHELGLSSTRRGGRIMLQGRCLTLKTSSQSIVVDLCSLL